jgi:hypothetical protein
MGGRGQSSESERKRMIVRITGNGGQRNPQAMDVSKFQGMSLEQIEDRIRNLNHEELFVLDKNGNVVEAFKGNKDSVAFTSDILTKYPDATVTHGHPKGLADFGGTFSLADVYNMTRSNWKEHRATASGKGEMNYIMRRTSKSDSAGLRKKIQSEENSIIKKFENAYNKGYNEASQKGLTGTALNRYARQKGVGVLNAYYKQTFQQYGFEYITRKTDYKYNR